MSVLFVSRDPRAREWAQARGLEVDEWVDHLDVTKVQPDDHVVGSLPVHLAAEVCAAGAVYWHLSMALDADTRGRELTRDEFKRCKPRLERYHIDLVRVDETGFLPGF